METQQSLTDVWHLESATQKWAGIELADIAEAAINGNRKLQNYLKKLWPKCSWITIKERLQIEGSVWYVWWMDGVNQHLQNKTN